MTRIQIARAFVVTAVLAAWATSGLAADDPNPSGTWKWSTERNGQTVETTLKLKLEGDKLTGTITGRDNTESAITEASFAKEGDVKFTVSRERNGQTFTIKYAGKVSGDSITGKIETTNGARDWKADRQK